MVKNEIYQSLTIDYARHPMFKQGGFIWGDARQIHSIEEYRERAMELHSQTICIHKEMTLDW